jgi:hypothetical protein
LNKIERNRMSTSTTPAPSKTHNTNVGNNFRVYNLAELPPNIDAPIARQAVPAATLDRDVKLLDKWLKASGDKPTGFKLERIVTGWCSSGRESYAFTLSRPSGSNSLQIVIASKNGDLGSAEMTKLGDSPASWRTDGMTEGTAASLLNQAAARAELSMQIETGLVAKWMTHGENHVGKGDDPYPNGSVRLPSGEEFRFEMDKPRCGNSDRKVIFTSKKDKKKWVEFLVGNDGLNTRLFLKGASKAEAVQLFKEFSVQAKKALGI